MNGFVSEEKRSVDDDSSLSGRDRKSGGVKIQQCRVDWKGKGMGGSGLSEPFG